MEELSAILREKGVSLVESPLVAEQEMLEASELSLRNQWMYYLYPELRALFKGDQMVQHFLRNSSYGDLDDIPALNKEKLGRFGEILIRPVRLNYDLVAERLKEIGLSGELGKLEIPLKTDGVFRPYCDAGVDYYTETRVLEAEGNAGFKWGPLASEFLASNSSFSSGLGGADV